MADEVDMEYNLLDFGNKESIEPTLPQWPESSEWHDVERLAEQVGSEEDSLLCRPTAFRRRVDEIFRDVSGLSYDLGNDYTSWTRASCLLGNINQTYYWCGCSPKDAPQGLQELWSEVRTKLGCKLTIKVGSEEEGYQEKECLGGLWFTYIDLIMANWKFRPSVSHKCQKRKQLRLEDIDLLFATAPPVGNQKRAEATFYLSQMLMLAHGEDLAQLCTQAQKNCSIANDYETNGGSERQINKTLKHLREDLENIRECWNKITAAFQLLNPHEGAGDGWVDQVFFARLFANTAIIPDFMKEQFGGKVKTPGPGGAATPVIQLMDFFTRRPSTQTDFLFDYNRLFTASYPEKWQIILNDIKDPSRHEGMHIEEYLVNRTRGREGLTPVDMELRGLYAQCLLAYQGEQGWHGVHTLKLYGFLSIMAKTGRATTIGGGSVNADVLYGMLEGLRLERFQGRCPTIRRQFAQVSLVKEVDAAEQVYAVQLSVKGQGVQCDKGDHLIVHVENDLELRQEFAQALEREFNNGMEHIVIPSLASEAQRAQRDKDGAQSLQSLWYHKVAMHESNKETLDQHTDLLLEDIARFGDYDSEVLRDFSKMRRAELLEKVKEIRPLEPRTFTISSVGSLDDHGFCKSIGLLVRKWPNGKASKMLRQGNWLSVNVGRLAAPSAPQKRRSLLCFAGGTGVSTFADLVQEDGQDLWIVWSSRGRTDQHAKFQQSVIDGRLDGVDAILTGKNNGRDKIRVGGYREHRDDRREHRLIRVLRRDLQDWLQKTCEEKIIKVCGSAGWCMEVFTCLQSLGKEAFDIAEWMGTGRLIYEVFSGPKTKVVDTISLADILEDALREQGERKGLTVIDDNVFAFSDGPLEAIHPGGRKILWMFANTDATQPFRVIGHHRNQTVTALMSTANKGAFESPKQSSITAAAWTVSGIHNVLGIDASLQKTHYAPFEGVNQSELHHIACFQTHQRFRLQHLPVLWATLTEVCTDFCPRLCARPELAMWFNLPKEDLHARIQQGGLGKEDFEKSPSLGVSVNEAELRITRCCLRGLLSVVRADGDESDTEMESKLEQAVLLMIQYQHNMNDLLHASMFFGPIALSPLLEQASELEAAEKAAATTATEKAVDFCGDEEETYEETPLLMLTGFGWLSSRW